MWPIFKTRISIFLSTDIFSGGGGGYLVYLVDEDAPFFRVSFSPSFYGTGYQSKDVFLEQVVKKAHFL